MTKHNVLILGVSCFEGMAGSTRVRNLIEPLLEKELIEVSNLIFTKKERQTEGTRMGIPYKMINLNEKKTSSIYNFISQGCQFIKKAKNPGSKNILYCYETPEVKTIFFILFAKMNGYKIVYDIVEDHRFALSYSGFMNKLRIKSIGYLIKTTPLIANHVIAISRHLESYMKEVCGTKIRVTMIPITVNFKFFSNTGNENTSKPVKIFYGGSFGEKDGLKYLIKGFELVTANNKDVSLVLTGKGEVSHDFQEIMNLINNSPSKDQIDYKGYLSTEEYYKVLNDCDIFCMTRNNSSYANAGFPFKLGEFLASGKAVIATNVGDIPKYLQNGINALVIKPESPEEIADAINYVLENPSEAKKLGIEARKTAEQYFDSAVLSDQLNQVFNTI